VEGHYAVGGLGSLACEVAAGNGLSCRIARCGVTASPAGAQGGQEFMNRLHGIAPEPVAEAAWTLLGGTAKRARPADWAPAAATDRLRAVPAKENPVGEGRNPQAT
jgi:hypothetical protein